MGRAEAHAGIYETRGDDAEMSPMQRHRDEIASLGCLLRKRGFPDTCAGGVELHHVAEGSGLRDNWALVPLCMEHHRGKAGLHGIGGKAFIRLYRPPGDSEYGLLVWLLEDMAKTRMAA